VNLIAALLAAPFIILTAAFAIELFVGLVPLPASPCELRTDGTAAIIVPAHNEEALIASSLEGLKDAAGTLASIMVIADNCDDATADIARGVSVDVVERTDPNRRGKGFALAYARDVLRQHPPDVVIVIDADCRSDSRSLRTLIQTCLASGRPCQATNLQSAADGASPAVQLSTFAFFIKNVVRQRALQRLARRVHLLGTGMAFPWAAFEEACLATANVAEDVHIGIWLAEIGKPAQFVEEANVWSDPESEKNMFVQRRRWEGGFLHNALHAAPLLLSRSVRCGDFRTLWAAINLAIPPLALLVLLDVVALVCASLLWLFGASVWPVVILTFTLLIACAGLTLAWFNGGYRFISARSFASIPRYVFCKIPMYLGFVRSGTPPQCRSDQTVPRW
jgi:cellulose synthase/poly-beta-1,6-N-acetylglucosamine synthase-like glycosyltransferase